MEDLDSNDIFEAYNRLSLLIDQQSKQKPTSDFFDLPQKDYEKNPPSILENKIDLLTNLIENENRVELKPEKPFPPLIESMNCIGSNNSFSMEPNEKYNEKFEKDITSKNIIPHMDELITVLVNNKIAESFANLQLNDFNSAKKQNKTKKIKTETIKKSKFDFFAIYKKSTNPKEFNKTLERFMQIEKCKNEKIEILKKELEENELKHLKSQPEINQESSMLVGQRSKPLHLRTEEILSAQKAKQNRLKDQMNMEKELKDPTSNHKPNLEWTRERSFSSAKKNRDYKEFIKDVEGWYKKRNEKIQTSQLNNLKEDFKKMPFRPQINKKRKNLTKLEEFNNIEERLIEAGKNYKEKERKNVLSLTPTFTPKINKYSLKIVEKLTEKANKKKEIEEFSSEKRKRPSFLTNTISFSTKEQEKFTKSVDEKDLKMKNKSFEENFGENNSKKKKKKLIWWNIMNPTNS